MTRSIRIVLLALVALASGCIVSPQPSPPNLAPEHIVPAPPGTDVIDGMRIVGEPGAVDPAEGVIVATSLDEEAPLVVEPVQGDGSFMLVVGGSGEHRLQARSGGARSRPADVIADVRENTIALAPRPLADCLLVDPSYELDLGEVRVGASAERSVRVDNACEVEITLAPASLREMVTPFSAIDGERIVPPGGATTITVRAAPTAAGATEGTLFVEAIAPTRDRRPLTLFVRGIE